MTKAEQIKINMEVEKHFNRFENESDRTGMQYIKKLRSCSADVWATDSYYVLMSYATIIAVIDADGTCYDFLRLVYGYTATSAQHIAKFVHDYGNGKKLSWKSL